MKISIISDSSNNGHMAFSEFQRRYLWNRDQIGGLFDSLFRRHPVGGLVVWGAAAEKSDGLDESVRSDGSDHIANAEGGRA